MSTGCDLLSPLCSPGLYIGHIDHGTALAEQPMHPTKPVPQRAVSANLLSSYRCCTPSLVDEVVDPQLAAYRRSAQRAGHVARSLPTSHRKGIQLSALIGLIAAICTLVVTVLGILAWLRGHSLVVRVHDPKESVERDNLSVIDVSRAMTRMTEDARSYRPDCIVGINRGGAIVGGWLAKQLQLETPILLIVNSDEPQGRRVTPRLGRNGQLVGRIYLVDDAQRKGEHMREALAYLVSKYPGVEIRRAVLLQMNVPHQGPESVTFRATQSEFVGFSTTNGSVVLPWDR